MNIMRNLFRRLGLQPSPLRGAAEGRVESEAETAAEYTLERRNCWLLVHGAMPRY